MFPGGEAFSRSVATKRAGKRASRMPRFIERRGRYAIWKLRVGLLGERSIGDGRWGAARRAVMFPGDHYSGGGSLTISPSQRYQVARSKTGPTTVERRWGINAVSKCNDPRRARWEASQVARFIDVAESRPWYIAKVQNVRHIAPCQVHGEGEPPMAPRRFISPRDIEFGEPEGACG